MVNTAGINLLDYNLFPKIAFAVSDESKCVSSVLRMYPVNYPEYVLYV